MLYLGKIFAENLARQLEQKGYIVKIEMQSTNKYVVIVQGMVSS